MRVVNLGSDLTVFLEAKRRAKTEPKPAPEHILSSPGLAVRESFSNAPTQLRSHARTHERNEADFPVGLTPRGGFCMAGSAWPGGRVPGGRVGGTGRKAPTISFVEKSARQKQMQCRRNGST